MERAALHTLAAGSKERRTKSRIGGRTHRVVRSERFTHIQPKTNWSFSWRYPLMAAQSGATLTGFDQDEWVSLCDFESWTGGLHDASVPARGQSPHVRQARSRIVAALHPALYASCRVICRRWPGRGAAADSMSRVSHPYKIHSPHEAPACRRVRASAVGG